MAHHSGAGLDVRPRRGGLVISGRAPKEQARRQEGQEEKDGRHGHQGRGDRNDQDNTRSRNYRGRLVEFIESNTAKGARAFTDENKAYNSLDNHEAVNHSDGECVREEARINGMESF